MSVPIPRFLLPRGNLYASWQPSKIGRSSGRPHQPLPCCRHVSAGTAGTPKIIRLEKPAKFVPPSHGKRLKQQTPRHYGPQLTEVQRREQETKKYPNMFPPEGTFMFWFLTSRGLHLFISLGTLVLLASFTAYENWKRDTAFRDQVPPTREFIWHPLASCSQVIEIYKMQVARTSAETAERRKRGVEDVQKRSTYRKAHGLESEESQGLGGWTSGSDEEAHGPSLNAEGPLDPKPVRILRDKSPQGSETVYGDVELKKRPVKKWLGIWE